MNPSVTILLASAGTGKTYRLTRHFLSLLLEGVAPSRVLATTFTRKAAGEILGRVLGRLAQAAGLPEDDDAGAAALAKELRRARCPVPEGLDRATCRAALERLVQELHRFQVRTLDSWFASLARAFAGELGLPPEWRVADEVEDALLRAEALGLLLAEGEAGDLSRLLRELQRSEGTARVHEDLLAIVQQAREVHADSTDEAWGFVRERGLCSDEDLEAAVRAFEAMDVPRTKAGAPDKNWTKAVQGTAADVRAGNWRAVLSKGLAPKLEEGTYSRHEITEEHLLLLVPLLKQALGHLVNELVAQNRATLELVPRFEEHLTGVRARRGLYGFGDVTAALAPRGDVALREFDLEYRLDGRVDHLLLDEFQDTNAQQFRVLDRVLQEIAAEGDRTRTLFCVGDVKQSIYGFRRAEPRLLDRLGERLLVEPEAMQVSFRSSPVVLEAVNRVFSGLEQRAPFDDGGGAHGDLTDAARDWCAGFQTHVVPEEHAGLPGCVQLREARPHDPDQERLLDPCVELAVQRVKALRDEAPQATIAVLLRTKRPVARLLTRLAEEDVPASGEGGVALTDAEEVRAALALLHLADHPDDTQAALVVALSPLAPEVDLEAEHLTSGVELARRNAARVSLSVRTRIQHEGLGNLLDALARRVTDPFGRRRFARLVEVGHAWAPRVGLRTRELVQHVEGLRVEDPSAANVRVLTIHASKGLEFDAVLLPELGGDFFRSGGRQGYLTRRGDPFQALDAVSVPASKDVLRHAMDLGALDLATRSRELTDVLSVLYVAMTRARHRLELLLPSTHDAGGKEVKDALKGYAALLRAALVDTDAAAPGSDGVLWEHSSEGPWMPLGEGGEDSAAPQEARPLRLRAGDGARSLPTRSPSSAAQGVLGVAELLRGADRRATRVGSAAHRLLQEVAWLDDGPDLDLLGEARRVLAGSEALEEERTEALALVSEALTAPDVREILTRGGRAGVELWRERRFSLLLPDAEGRDELWSGSFDRVELELRDGRPVAATLYDWKTDLWPDAEALAERVRHHRPQLEAYRRVLTRLTGLDPSAVSARLVFLRGGRVVTLDP